MKGKYTVVVGNIGMVCQEVGRQAAMKTYREYRKQSKNGYGRASGEDVTVLKDGEILCEYIGTISRNQED